MVVLTLLLVKAAYDRYQQYQRDSHLDRSQGEENRNRDRDGYIYVGVNVTSYDDDDDEVAEGEGKTGEHQFRTTDECRERCR
mmetsp:Transcript_20590/g.43253  ORF Transcript_20590/g.43253 Transcript_20590/m.43253 type:complete len:82 (-) Transcript_20590:1086-1331(-)